MRPVASDGPRPDPASGAALSDVIAKAPVEGKSGRRDTWTVPTQADPG